MSDQKSFLELFASESCRSDEEIAAPWKVLMVDDEPDMHAALRLVLQNEKVDDHPLQLLEAESSEEAKALLKKHPDVALILLDVVMETHNAGLDLVEYIRTDLENDHIQILLLTGQPGYAPPREVAANYAINSYHLKSEMTADRIFVSIYGALRTYQVMKESVRQQERLAKSEQRYVDLYNSSPDMYVSVDAATATVVECNQTMSDKLGYSKDEIFGQPIFEFYHPDSLDDAQAAFRSFVETGVVNNTELQLKQKNGSKIDVNLNVIAIRDENQKIVESRSCLVDITEQKRREAESKRLRRELQQAQKMEALGQLTGGIAHEFNNILGIVLGYIELSLNFSRNGRHEKLTNYLNQTEKAAVRAKELVAQMMTFSRIDTQSIGSHQLYALISEDLKMLRPSLPSSIEIINDLNEYLPSVLIDPVQLNQVLLNLFVNARDAMDGKGVINISLRMAKDICVECSACHANAEGDYVELSITDNGCGIKNCDLDRIFDPFYSTKDVGKGSGMGLSVVNGILRKLDAHILVETEVSKGTTFRLLFKPVIDGDTDSVPAKLPSVEMPQGQGEHVLVVDDEPELAEILADLLRSKSYSVTSFTSSKEALGCFSNNPDKFSLIVTDQTMPELSGIELVKNVSMIRPGFPVIIDSGYSEKIDEATAAKLNIRYLKKPIIPGDLFQSVAELLNQTEEDTSK